LALYFLAKEYYWAKSAHKMLMELTTGVNFTNVFLKLICAQIQKAQKDSQVISVFCVFGKCSCKNCLQNIGEIGFFLYFCLQIELIFGTNFDHF